MAPVSALGARRGTVPPMATIKIIYETTQDEVLGALSRQYRNAQAEFTKSGYLRGQLQSLLHALATKLDPRRHEPEPDRNPDDDESETKSRQGPTDLEVQQWTRELYGSLSPELIEMTKAALGHHDALLFVTAATMDDPSLSALMIRALRCSLLSSMSDKTELLAPVIAGLTPHQRELVENLFRA